MGLDCSLYAFPTGHAMRIFKLGRYSIFSPAISAHFKDNQWHNPVPLSEFRSIAGCDNDAEIALAVIENRFGSQTPVMIYDENWEWEERIAECPIYQRMDRIDTERRRRKISEENQVVKEWLVERNRRQYGDGVSLSFSDYLAEKQRAKCISSN